MNSVIECVKKTFEKIFDGDEEKFSEFRLAYDPIDSPRLEALKIIDYGHFDVAHVVIISDNKNRYAAIFGKEFEEEFVDSVMKNVYAFTTDNLPSVLFRIIGEKVFDVKKITPTHDIEAELQDLDIKKLPAHLILSYFEKFILIEIDEDSSINKFNAMQFFCFLIINKYGLRFGLDFTNSASRFMIDESDSIMPLYNLEMSIRSSYPKHSFLEAYRTIEALYAIPHSIKLKNVLTEHYGLGDVSGIMLAKVCKEQLKWNRKEQDSLIQLFDIIYDNDLDLITNRLRFFATNFDYSTEIKERSQKIAEKIYKIRNYNVHFISFDEPEMTNLENTDYMEIAYFLWEFSFSAYKKLKTELSNKN